MKLNRNSCLEIEYDHLVDYPHKLLLINNSASATPWAIVNKREKAIIESLQKPITFGALSNIFKNYDLKSLNEFLAYLYDSGILRVGGKPKFSEALGCSNKFDVVVIKITKACNLRCLYCYSPQESGDAKAVMDYKTLRRILFSFCAIQSKLPQFTFHGGEPLLRFPDIKKAYEGLIAEGLAKEVSFSIQSNGTILNQDILRFLQKAYPQVSYGFSMDGPPQINDQIRFGSEQRAFSLEIIKNIKLLQKHKIFPAVLFVLTSKNLPYIDKIFDFFVKHKVSNLVAMPFFPSGRGEEHSELAITSQDYFIAMKKLFYKIYNYNRRHREKVDERTISNFLGHILTPWRAYMCKRMPCGAGINTLAFDCNGDVYPCDDFFGRQKFLLGNIERENLKSILKRSRAKLSPLINRSFAKLGCGDCPWQGICGGGCPGANYAFYKTLDKKDYFCEFNQKFIRFLFDLIVNEKVDLSVLR